MRCTLLRDDSVRSWMIDNMHMQPLNPDGSVIGLMSFFDEDSERRYLTKVWEFIF
jgi:hypothetical protein